MPSKTSQNLTIYLGNDRQRKSRIRALDRLAKIHVPDAFIHRQGSERSVLFQLLADNPNAADEALNLFFSLIGWGSDDKPPPVVLWNGRQWTIKAAPLGESKDPIDEPIE